MQIALAALVLVLPLWTLLSSYIDNYASGTQAENLTGRLGIWAIMMSDAIEMPWFGSHGGFHSSLADHPARGPGSV